MMDPTTLPEMPAPFWFIQLFKVLGFLLHTIPMGIWFAGLPVALGCALWNCRHSRRFAHRLFGQLPIFMALGINFGIVPLLFLQTTYYKSFYTATILMAWHWLAVIPILIVGYYSLYIASFCREDEAQTKRKARMILAGTIASFCLIAIGILITNGMTLLADSALWPSIMERTNYYGATTGLANQMRNPTVWLRLATMFGLGLMTSAAWIVVDAQFLTGSKSGSKEQQEQDTNYRSWSDSLALLLAVLGLLIMAVIYFVPGSETLPLTYPHFIFVLISGLVTVILLGVKRLIGMKSVVLIALIPLTQLLTLAIFGVIRQLGQNAAVANYVDVSLIPTRVQWSPLLAFLVCFLLGLILIGWMLKQCILIQAEPQQERLPDADR